MYSRNHASSMSGYLHYMPNEFLWCMQRTSDDDRLAEHSAASNSVGDGGRNCHFRRTERGLITALPARSRSSEPNCWKVPCLSQYSSDDPDIVYIFSSWSQRRGTCTYERLSMHREDDGTRTWTDRSPDFSSPLIDPFFSLLFFLWQNNDSNSFLTKRVMYSSTAIFIRWLDLDP